MSLKKRTTLSVSTKTFAYLEELGEKTGFSPARLLVQSITLTDNLARMGLAEDVSVPADLVAGDTYRYTCANVPLRELQTLRKKFALTTVGAVAVAVGVLRDHLREDYRGIPLVHAVVKTGPNEKSVFILTAF